MSASSALIDTFTPDMPAMHGAPRVRCLLVDDDRFDRYNVRYAAERAGVPLDVAEAPTLAAARRHLAEERFGLIVLDQYLPDGLGLDITAEILTNRLSAHTPMIMITGAEDSWLSQRSAEQGCIEFLTKGNLNGPNFGAALRRALERSAARFMPQDFPRESEAFDRMLDDFGAPYAAQTLKPAVARLVYLADALSRSMSGSEDERQAIGEMMTLCRRLWAHLDTGSPRS
ncbi:MAG: response regulator [Pseudomonadota bacterium]